jgi:hypothetical protein
MSRRPARITEADITRAVRAYGKAGQQVRVIFAEDGSTVIEPVMPGAATATTSPESEQNEWNSVK